MEICVLRAGRLAVVPVMYNTQTGDSTYLDRPFSQAFPMDSTYAANAQWYVDHYPIAIPGNRYRFVKYGLPRVLGPTELEPGGMYGNVPFFVEAGTKAPWEVVYLPVHPGCVFQPYQASGPK